MSDRFEICHPVTAGWEGGWSNHPDDPGGATMYGVIQTVYDAYRVSLKLAKQSVAKITKAEALDIFRKNYWNAAGCDTLFPGVDLAVYDASVNSGVSRGRKWLLASVGDNDHSKTVQKICKARLSFLNALKTFKTFGKGWTNRVVDIEAKGVKMALEAMQTAPAQIVSLMTAHAVTADKDAKTANTQAKAAGAGAVATPSVGITQADAFTAVDWLILGGVGLAFVGIVIYLLKKRSENTARAEAYKAAVA